MSRECCGGPEVHEVTTGPGETAGSEELTPWWRDRALALPVASGLLLVAGYLLAWSDLDRAALVAHSLGLAAGAWTFVPGALRNLAKGRLGVGLLMTIAAVGAIALGHVGEAAALAFLFSIAETLEDRAMDRARHGLSALLALMPETARLSTLTGTRTVPAADVRRLDVLVVGAGERVATDGVVVSGRSSLDTSAITGESIPVEVGPGDEVLAGAVNGGGALEVEASADGTDNSLTTIVRLVQEAHERKGERARLADRIARPLVPIVLVTAVLVAVAGSMFGDSAIWIERALVVLVAASPCALAIAVPVTVISAIGSASRLGVVIKSGEAFERFGTISQVAFDKTGTLTRNQPRVVAVETVDGVSDAEVLALAAALERSSTHPLATAVIAAADTSLEAVDVTEHPGHGISATIDGTTARVGNPRWIDLGYLSERGAAMADAGMSVIVVERDGQTVGAIGVRDELRPEAAEAIRALRDAGIEPVMLTGDNARTAHALAAEAGITAVHAEQLPQDKARVIEQMTRTAPTAMVGDGINDAPALAGASIGIAMGASGSAAAIESADVAFTGHDLRFIPDAIAHARRGRAIMTGNIALALAIIIILFPLALFGLLGLAGVVLVHELAEVVVIGNGIRAARVRREPRDEITAPVEDTASKQSGEGCADGCCTNHDPVLSLTPRHEARR